MSGQGFVTPEIVVSHFNVMDGDTVADFGAGSGYFLKAISARVGTGKVYACEIQKQLVERIGEQARADGLRNVFPLWCDLEEANGLRIPEGTVDVGMLINTLFQIEDKDTAVKEMNRVMRQGGKFFIIDWSESFGGTGPHADHVVSKQDAIVLCERNGFVFDREYPAGEHHYGLAFRKL